jgi:endonuclease YncB( thermonuclease family)
VRYTTWAQRPDGDRRRVHDHERRQATVIDGDTLIIGATRIRLAGIDAPEGAQSCAKPMGQARLFGAASREEPGALAQGQGGALRAGGARSLRPHPG